MRKLLRKIARANMKKEGIQHMNKKVFVFNPTTKIVQKSPSFFATNWRKYC